MVHITDASSDGRNNGQERVPAPIYVPMARSLQGLQPLFLAVSSAEGRSRPWLHLPSDAHGAGFNAPASFVKRANIYVDASFGFVVTSEDPLVSDHGSLHGALCDYLRAHPERAGCVELGSLAHYQVAAFVDGPNILIRIEDARSLFEQLSNAISSGGDVSAARQQLLGQVDRYRRAIDVALEAIRDGGGDVLLLVGGFSPEDTKCRMSIAKMLGEAHRVHEEDAGSTRAKFVSSHLVTPRWGRYYYRKEQGTRYISADQVAALTEHVEEQAIFIEGINQISSWLRKRNQQGAREAVLLLIDETGTTLKKDSSVERTVKDQFSSLAEFASCIPASEWPLRYTEIEQRLAELVQTMRAGTHPDFASDDLLNPRYVEVLTDILRGQSSKMPLGGGFSTPLKAIEVGRFKTSPHGAKVFEVTATDGLQREIVGWFMTNDNLPGRSADWLCVLEPQIALTPDYHPARIARALLPQDETNFVVLTGIAGASEHKMVVRENPYSARHWDTVRQERFRHIQNTHSSEALADAALQAMQMQFRLMNGLWNSLDPADGDTATALSKMCVPPFEPIKLSQRHRYGDFLVRPFIDGLRVDLLNRLEMSPDRMEFALYWVGKIMAVNFLAQRPALSMHELLSVSTPVNYIRSIGTSESFCNAIDVDSIDEAIGKAGMLYGAHLATWLMSLRFGAYGKSLASSEEVDRNLMDICLLAFEEGLRDVATHAPKTFMPIVEQVRVESAANGSLLQEVSELDMAKNLSLTLQLLNLTADERSRLVESIRTVARDICDCLGRVCTERFDDDDGQVDRLRCALQREREILIDRVYSFVGNHVSGQRFSVVLDVLGGRIMDFGSYSLEERTWLLTILDVELWMTEVGHDADRSPLWLVASESGTEREFLDRVREDFRHACLTEKRARELYDAVHGLEREVGDSPERKIQLEQDLLNSCGFTPPWGRPTS